MLFREKTHHLDRILLPDLTFIDVVLSKLSSTSSFYNLQILFLKKQTGIWLEILA